MPNNYCVIGNTVHKGYWKQFIYPFQKAKPQDTMDVSGFDLVKMVAGEQGGEIC